MLKGNSGACSRGRRRLSVLETYLADRLLVSVVNEHHKPKAVVGFRDTECTWSGTIRPQLRQYGDRNSSNRVSGYVFENR